MLSNKMLLIDLVALSKVPVYLFLTVAWTISYADVGPPVQLNSKLLDGQDVLDHPYPTRRISPDSKHVVYLADQEEEDFFELYSVPIGGGVPNKLRLDGVRAKFDMPGGVRSNFEITGDSRYVVYISDQEIDGKFELYRVPITGGTPVKLSVEIGLSGDVNDFKITPDGLRVVYRYAPISGIEPRLRSVLINGENTRTILGFVKSANDWEINPQGTQVVYLANSNISNIDRLYSYSFENAARREISLAGDTLQRVKKFKIGPQGMRVYYSARRNGNTFETLFSSSIEDGTSPRTHTIELAEYSGDIIDFAVDPTNTYVVYSQVSPANVGQKLFSVPIRAFSTERKELSKGLPFDAGISHFQISSDGRYVTFRFPKGNGTRDKELYSVRIIGGQPAKLNGNLTESGDVDSDYKISPDARYVYYSADQEAGEGEELYRVPINGGLSEKLNRGLARDKDVTSFILDSLAENILYLTRSDSDGPEELYFSAANGANVARVNRQLPTASEIGVGDYSFSPDGAYAVYLAEQNVVDQAEIFSASLADNDFCFPVRAKNSNTAVVCL